MIGEIKYECTVLNGTGKKGKLKCDPDGYYDVILGGFDVRNTRGDLWPMSSARPHLEASSGLMKRINQGFLYGEWGHPNKQPGMSHTDFINRVLNVHEGNVSHHVKSITVDESGLFAGDGGKPAVVIFGRVKPFGPHAQLLADSLENNAQNTSFSIRTLTRDTKDLMGRATKNILTVVTWDAVLSPGIDFSTKFANPSLETDSVRFTESDLRDAYKDFKGTPGSFENGFLGDRYKEVMRNMGNQAPDQKTGLILPPSARW